MTNSSVHDPKEVTCHHRDALTAVDATTMSFRANGRYVSSPSGEDRHGNQLTDRFASSALRFDCPTCGATHWSCTVCSDHLDPDDPSAHPAPGWFYGDSTDAALACHNCNQAEAARQRRGRGRVR